MPANRQTGKRWWSLSLGLGIVACLAGCAGPLLAAAGIAVACEWSLPGSSWLEPVGIALVIVSIIGLAMSFRHVRGDGRCGSPMCTDENRQDSATTSLTSSGD